MFLFYVLCFFKKGDIIQEGGIFQARTLFREIRYLKDKKIKKSADELWITAKQQNRTLKVNFLIENHQILFKNSIYGYQFRRQFFVRNFFSSFLKSSPIFEEPSFIEGFFSKFSFKHVDSWPKILLLVFVLKPNNCC